jgi:hypothetical protein
MIFTSPDPLLINHLRNLLENEGIETYIRQRYLGGALGELPFTECWPQLWLRDDRDEQRARAILGAVRDIPGDRWRCGCGELLAGQFTTCWRCGRDRDTQEGG